MAILIKRYANRKLYNTDTSRYITLKGIAKLLAEGEEVRVVDKETGEDITQVALSQILVDSQRARQDPSDTLLAQLLSRGGDALYGAIKKSVDEATDGIGEFQDRFRNLVRQAEAPASGRGFPWEPRERDRRSPFSTGPGAPSTGQDPTGQDPTGQDAPRARERDVHGSEAAGAAPGRGDRSFEPDASRAQRDEESDASSRARTGWPRIAGLPDLRELVRSVVAKELEALDLPRNRDIRALNENLTRVAEAVERLEKARSEPESRSESRSEPEPESQPESPPEPTDGPQPAS